MMSWGIAGKEVGEGDDLMNMGLGVLNVNGSVLITGSQLDFHFPIFALLTWSTVTGIDASLYQLLASLT